MRNCLFYFFFSSRRRHTRSLCDWSSDVCSSDLGAALVVAGTLSSAAAGRRSGNEAPEEIVERVVLLQVRSLGRGGAAFARLGGADIDDRRTLLFCEIGEVGQLAPLGLQRGRQPQEQPNKQYSCHREILGYSTDGSHWRPRQREPDSIQGRSPTCGIPPRSRRILRSPQALRRLP